MRTVLRLLLLIVVGGLLSPSFSQAAKGQDPALEEALDLGRQALALRDLASAERHYRGALQTLELDRNPSVAIDLQRLLADLAHAQGKLGPALEASLAAIALADSQPESPLQLSTRITVRLELAKRQQESGDSAGAEATCWDAVSLAHTAERLEELAAPLALLLEVVVRSGVADSALWGLFKELDLLLAERDDYRLHQAPPPEPIALLLEAEGQQRVVEGDFDAALQTFRVLLAVDQARGADWRLSTDWSQVAKAGLLAGRPTVVRWAIQGADALGASPTVALEANRCELLELEGRLSLASAACEAASELAGTLGDRFSEAALQARLAELAEQEKQTERALKHRRKAARLFTELQADGDAATEEASALRMLSQAGRLEEAEALATKLAEGPLASLPAVAGALHEHALGAWSADPGRMGKDEVLSVLGEVGTFLFSEERAEDLVRLSFSYFTLAMESDSDTRARDVEEAVQAIGRLEEEVGLGPWAWVGALAKARWARERGEPEKAIDLLLPALERIESWEHGAGLGVTRDLSAAPVIPGPSVESLYAEVLDLLVEQGRAGDAFEVGQRLRTLRSLRAQQANGSLQLVVPDRSPRGVLHRLHEQIRAHRDALMQVSLRGGELPPSELRAPLLESLQGLLDRQKELVASSSSLRGVCGLGQELSAPTAGSASVLSVLDVEGSIYLLWLGPSGDAIAQSLPAMPPSLVQWESAEGRERLAGSRGQRLLSEASDWLLQPVVETVTEADGGVLMWLPSRSLQLFPLEALSVGQGRSAGVLAEEWSVRTLQLPTAERPHRVPPELAEDPTGAVPPPDWNDSGHQLTDVRPRWTLVARWRIPPRAERLFHSAHRLALQEGSSVPEATDRARRRVRRAFPSPAVWAAWELREDPQGAL